MPPHFRRSSQRGFSPSARDFRKPRPPHRSASEERLRRIRISFAGSRIPDSLNPSLYLQMQAMQATPWGQRCMERPLETSRSPAVCGRFSVALTTQTKRRKRLRRCGPLHGDDFACLPAVQTPHESPLNTKPIAMTAPCSRLAWRPWSPAPQWGGTRADSLAPTPTSESGRFSPPPSTRTPLGKSPRGSLESFLSPDPPWQLQQKMQPRCWWIPPLTPPGTRPARLYTRQPDLILEHASLRMDDVCPCSVAPSATHASTDSSRLGVHAKNTPPWPCLASRNAAIRWLPRQAMRCSCLPEASLPSWWWTTSSSKR